MSKVFEQRSVAIAVFALSFGMSPSVSANELILSSWLPPKHLIVTHVIKPWAEDVEAATEGRVSIRVLQRPLGPPPAHFDLAADGDADITYGLHSFTRDNRFLRSRIGQFSFLGDDAAATSNAYWKVYSEDLDAAQEHEGTKLLSLWVHGPGKFHNNQRSIQAPEDFEGLKIRVPGGYVSELIADLGATTQFMGPSDVFERLSTGVIDGVTFPSEALSAFNLSDHLSNTLTVPGGLYNTSWFMVMNEERWEELSEQDRAAISKISGAALAERAGSVWNDADNIGLAHAASANVQTQEANAAVLTKIKELAEIAEKTWADQIQEQGFDGQSALKKLRELAQ